MLHTQPFWFLAAGISICRICLRTFCRVLVLCLRLLQFVPTSCSPRLMSLACCRTHRPLRLCGRSRPWWMLPLARLVLVIAASIPVVLLLGHLLLASVAVSLGLRLLARIVCASAPLLLALLCSLRSGVFGDRGHVFRPFSGVVWGSIGGCGSLGLPSVGLWRSCGSAAVFLPGASPSFQCLHPLFPATPRLPSGVYLCVLRWRIVARKGQ